MPPLARLTAEARRAGGGLPRQFWWLWTSTLVNRLGGFVVTFLAMYLTQQRGYSAAYAGLVASLFGLGSAVAAVGAGVLTDRLGRRPTLLAAQLSTALFTALLGFADGPAAIAAVAFLVGLASNASRPAVSAMIADLVPAADRVRAYALNYWAINIGFGASAAVAGLIAVHGYLTLFLLDAATTLLCAVVVFVKVPETRPDAAPDAAPAAAAGREPRVGLGTVFRDGPFMAVVAVNLLLALVVQQGSTTLPVDMGAHGLSTTEFGLVISLNGALIVLLQLPLTRLMENRDRTALLVAGALLTGWGFGLTALAGSSAALYALAVAVWTVGEIVTAPTMMALVAEHSPARARGRYQGVYSLSWSLASFAGPLGGGLLLQYAGSWALWGGCAAAGTLAAAAFVRIGRRPARPEPVPAVPAGSAGSAAAVRAAEGIAG
ncbi:MULTISPECIES: MFS transporter [Kitasatospora]|uniref:Putative major facilitator superfamily transporter n=1 Tax=Kitasatospora setae (strain ATCC 33774 / DSM 43861 / JCM 3304 / KCC A-0304 / NBRC 14216 / KM-6054) TaxID=452652 RepID=E4NDI2_KITSK|nr:MULTISPECIES: MFS transporter [Kitasatospora]BAJ29263.1 putative major facilitator superfamily transporter [Kitasatospora setae KM-6054]